MKTYSSVTIIFPTQNNWSDTKKCLQSISKLNYPKEKLTVIVVDNASIDETVKELKKFSLQSSAFSLQIIENKTNIGFGRAINKGVREATSEFILITNNDIVFAKNFLDALVKTLLSHPKVGAVGGKVYYKGQNRLCIDGFRLNPYLAYRQFDLSGINHQRECDWLSGHCILVKRKLFLDLGCFDESYFIYFEDIDFCLRLRRIGLKLLFEPKAIAYHSYGKTMFKKPKSRIFFLNYQSRWRCLFKNASLIQILTSSIFLLIIAPLLPSLLTRYNVYIPMLRGLYHNLTNLKQIKRLKNES